MNAPQCPSRLNQQSENCLLRTQDTTSLKLLLESFLKRHGTKVKANSTETLTEHPNQELDRPSSLLQGHTQQRRKRKIKEAAAIHSIQSKHIRLTLGSWLSRKQHQLRHIRRVNRLTANLNENNDKSSFVHYFIREDSAIERREKRKQPDPHLDEFSSREVRPRRSSFNTNPLSSPTSEEDLEVDSNISYNSSILDLGDCQGRDGQLFGQQREHQTWALPREIELPRFQHFTNPNTRQAQDNNVFLTSRGQRTKFRRHITVNSDEDTWLRSPYHRHREAVPEYAASCFAEDLNRGGKLEDSFYNIQGRSISREISSVSEKLCALNSNANAASGGQTVIQANIEALLIDKSTAQRKYDGISTCFATSRYVAEESDVTAPSEKTFGQRTPESSSVGTLKHGDATKRSDCLQQFNKSVSAGRWRSVNLGSSDKSLTENEEKYLSTQVYKEHQASRPSHINCRKQKRFPEQCDRGIAAEVRCTCRIAISKEKCQLCRSSSSCSKIETKPLRLIGLRRSPVWKAVQPNPKSNFGDRLELFSFTPNRKITADVSRNESRARTDQEIAGRTLNRRHHSYSNNRSSKSDIPTKNQKEANCCDAFRLLFGNSSATGEAPLVLNKLLYAAQAASPKRSNLGILTSDQLDMGCFHSVSNKSKVGPCRTNIFSDVQATIDQSPTVIEEYSPIVLRYRTPYFRANAQVIMPPIRRKETWTVGWIQACDYMKFINQYGTLGCSSWEIPALKSGRIPAVSDSDGVSYPWYGNTTEIATIVGPTDSYRRMNLTMNDNFYPSVTWDIPVSEGTNAHLTRIVRDQSFITWLAAVNETTKDIIVLKTVRWNFYLEIDIDPTRELGQRARIVAPRAQKQPLVTNGPGDKNRFQSPVRGRRRGTDNNSNSTYVGQIPISALVRPSANNAQTLIWRPTENQPIVVVPAKEEHRDTNELILFNGCSAMHGKESIIKEISKQEVIQLQQMARRRTNNRPRPSGPESPLFKRWNSPDRLH
uniref:uncharacterized protein LOC494362 isoform X2 n=1 Tax=Ciona intestinalis TaxID=7719 RepID=UPI000EF493FB|nr:uncharacterized protein LOC494362 isoform X2 [Ciona intestinalis]|eukprot:XP_026691870.1 uncharacterized protein LOC494362 isoform X2 [Ciona intestinalis]